MEDEIIKNLTKTIDKLRREVVLLLGYKDLSEDLGRRCKNLEKALDVKRKVLVIEGYYRKDMDETKKLPSNLYRLEIVNVYDTKDGMIIRVIID
jgi:hypothetical protein